MATCHHLSGATWRKHCSPTVRQPPPDYRSTVVNGGSQRWSTTVTIAGPPVNDGQQWRTTVDHRRTTGQPAGHGPGRFIADNIAKDICSFVLSSEKQVSPRSNCSCKELQSNYDKGHSRVVALEAEVLEKQQMLAKSEHQSSLIQKQFVDLQLKFQNYKERLRNEKVCVPPNATASNAIFEINQLKYQLQRKDDTIRNLETHINITRMLNVGPTTGSLDQQALETEVTQLKDALLT
ncbi:hypothetical protein Tco_0238186 [Tanacetum coccineum]